MNAHAPAEAVEFFAWFQFVGKPYFYKGEKYLKAKLKSPMTSRRAYFYSFKYNALSLSFDDFKILQLRENPSPNLV